MELYIINVFPYFIEDSLLEDTTNWHNAAKDIKMILEDMLRQVRGVNHKNSKQRHMFKRNNDSCYLAQNDAILLADEV